MKSFKFTKCLIFLLLVFECGSSWSENKEFEPARFRENLTDLAAKIRFPDDSFNGITIVRGAAYATKYGQLRSIGFYRYPSQTDVFEPFEKSVDRVIRKSLILPARIDGKMQNVWFNFSVIFDNSDNKKEIRIVHNLLYDKEKHGENYYDPQRIVSTDFPKVCKGGTALWMSTEVSSDGSTSSTKPVIGKASDACQKELKKIMSESKYIPAQVNENYVKATYVEVWQSR